MDVGDPDADMSWFLSRCRRRLYRDIGLQVWVVEEDENEEEGGEGGRGVGTTTVIFLVAGIFLTGNVETFLKISMIPTAGIVTLKMFSCVFRRIRRQSHLT